MQLLKKHVTRTAVALALGAGALVGGSSTASAADVHPQYVTYKCDDGRACVYDRSGGIWNMDGCGPNYIYGVFYFAKAHGNSFTVWYQNNTWDLVPAWSQRFLDAGNKVTEVDVHC
ncbi:hypothetical protein R6V09_04640 [Streptomyces sp. W16]|uniref:hypothetical protein n=1 Tax=Streptomyces sp. W16 TaxID=3076631 RepID=UPI00295A67A3|nr:hypothetical protein [Streptomyces sp. W16]MDV9169424.1 hypothetical protein [Streptomyces sp. W16]